MSKITRKEWYRRVNASWPQGIPPLTAEEGVRAAKRLYRFGMRRTWRGDVIVTSGNRNTWIRYRRVARPDGTHGWRLTLYVNPEKGWHELVHALSHYCHDHTAPAEDQGHTAAHARAEMRMIKEVVRRGWLDGKLKDEPKPEPEPVDPRAVKMERTAASIERWEKKLRRAENALKKLRRSQRAMERYAEKRAVA